MSAGNVDTRDVSHPLDRVTVGRSRRRSVKPR